MHHKAETLGDSIFITGGYASGYYLSGVLIYDITNKAYSQGLFLNTERSYHNMVRIGKCLYVLGGNNNSNPDSTAVNLIRYCSGEPFAALEQTPDNNNSISVIQGVDVIKISSSFNANDPIQLEIVDLLGKVVYVESFSGHSVQLETRLVLPVKGTYVCNVRQGTIETRVKLLFY